MASYADFSDLAASYQTARSDNDEKMKVTLENTSGSIAFIIELQVVGEKS